MPSMNDELYAEHATPLGQMWSTWTSRGLHRLDFTKPAGPMTRSIDLEMALDGFFHGDNSAIDSLALDATGWTQFTRQVYEACRRIPIGQTVSYQQLAATVGRPNASRAVGGAMSRNRLLLVIPCHRVIASNGKLTGFSAPGGLETKQRLLDLEQSATPTDPSRCDSADPRSR